MVKNRDYIPRKDTDFDRWLSNVIEYVEEKTSGTTPSWAQIPKSAVTELKIYVTAWKNAWEKCRTPHTRTDTREKTRIRKDTEKRVRAFVNQYLRFSPVSSADRDNMGIRNPELVRTPVNAPDKLAAFILAPKANGLLTVRFWEQGAASKARPYGYDGAVICWAVLDKPPKSHKELSSHVLATRTPHTLTFDETERGKAVHVAVYWQNNKGEQGPWSLMQSTVVP